MSDQVHVRVNLPTRHLSRIEDALRNAGYQLTYRLTAAGDEYGVESIVASVETAAPLRPAMIASGVAFHPLPSSHPSDASIVKAFREASGIAGEKLLDDRTRKGLGEMGPIHTTLTVLHSARAKDA